MDERSKLPNASVSPLLRNQHPVAVFRLHLDFLAQAFYDVATVALAYQADASREVSLTRSYDFILSASAEARAAVLRDPRVAIWIENAQIRIGEPEGLSLPGRTWTQLLALYPKCALAIAYLEHINFSATVAVDAHGQIALPGCKLLISAHEYRNSVVQLDVHDSGDLLLNGRQVQVQRPPTTGIFELGAEEADLQPPPEGSQYALDGAASQNAEWLEALTDAERMLSLHSPSCDLVRYFGTVIVPIKGGEIDTHCSVSFSAKPGVLYMSLGPGRVLAEALVHESDHQVVYVLKRFVEFWSDPAAEQLSIYRSPWRDDPRPLDGLLRGASAFVRVGAFWAHVIARETLARDYDRVGLRAVLSLQQSFDAIRQIRHYGVLTPDGLLFIDQLELVATGSLNELQSMRPFYGWKTKAEETRRIHDKEWEARHGGKDRVSAEPS